MFLMILLQLVNNKEIKWMGALLYALGVLLVIIVHESLVRRVFIQKYKFYQLGVKSLICNLLLALVSSLVLTLYGYFILVGFLKPEYQVEIKDLLTSMFFGLFLVTIFISGMSYAIETVKRNVVYEKKQQQLEKNVLKMEIAHLRQQLSPHFTFNILNNLQFLIRKDKEEALELLSRYSKILKYYIYESQHKYIKLDDEITFLRYYFQLEKDKSDKELEFHFTVDYPEHQLLIIPFLLSTFLENAFKHGTANEHGNFIRFHLFVEKATQLNLTIENTFSKSTAEGKKPGVGLEQARKRLELSYPNNYQLQQEALEGIYQVQLQLNLSTSS